MTESASPQLADERASAAEHKLVDTEAKLGRTENERDVAVKTAEAADVINKDLVGRIEEVSREAGRQQGVNEVLKDQIRQNLDAPAAPQVAVPDQKPLLDVLNRIDEKLDRRPEPQATVVHTEVGPGFWSRYRSSLAAKLSWLIVALLLLALVYFFWAPISSSIMSVFSSFSHHEDTTVIVSPPADPIPATTCTVPGSVYVDVLERCVMLPPQQD